MTHLIFYKLKRARQTKCEISSHLISGQTFLTYVSCLPKFLCCFVAVSKINNEFFVYVFGRNWNVRMSSTPYPEVLFSSKPIEKFVNTTVVWLLMLEQNKFTLNVPRYALLFINYKCGSSSQLYFYCWNLMFFFQWCILIT